MTTTPPNPTTILADIATALALTAYPTATPDGLCESIHCIVRHAATLLDALAAAEQREAEALAALSTARAALHSARARELADTLSPPAPEGPQESQR